MKTNLFTTAIFALLWLSIFQPAFAQQIQPSSTPPPPPQAKALKTAGTNVVLPTEVHLLQWRSNSASWDTLRRIEYAYQNGTDWISEETIFDYISGGTFDDPFRIITQFNTNGQILQQRREEFTGTYWQSLVEYTHAYDSAGALTTLLDKTWDFANGGWDTLSFQRYVYNYNSFGEWDSYDFEYYPLSLQQWLPNEHADFTYNSNQEWESKTTTRLPTNATIWDTVSVEKNYVWEDFQARKPKAYVLKSYYNGLPTNTHKYARDWFPYDSYDEYSLWLNTSQIFDSTDKNTVTYNQNGHKTFDLRYAYNTNTQNWDLQGGGRRYTHTYNPDGSLSETLLESYLSGPMTYEPTYKWIYSDFITANAPPIASNSKVTWAPHPAGPSSTVLLDSPLSGSVSLNLHNMQGSLVKAFDFEHNGGQSRHSLQLDLPAGLYMYSMQLKNQAVTGKLLVR